MKLDITTDEQKAILAGLDRETAVARRNQKGNSPQINEAFRVQETTLLELRNKIALAK